jgi:hypothetical protein
LQPWSISHTRSHSGRAAMWQAKRCLTTTGRRDRGNTRHG